jgi:hypothetical protein
MVSLQKTTDVISTIPAMIVPSKALIAELIATPAIKAIMVRPKMRVKPT